MFALVGERNSRQRRNVGDSVMAELGKKADGQLAGQCAGKRAPWITDL